MSIFRKQLSAPGLLSIVHSAFSKVPDPGIFTKNVMISITDHLMKIVNAGRARWKIENETFNTLKNLGYNFEHNYGHGKKYLSTVLCLLMMLAFLIDQVQEICCSLFQQCKKFSGTYRDLWSTMRTFFHYVRLGNWENFYMMIGKRKTLNSS